MVAKNIERFNTIVGLAFEQLYRSFPMPITINDAEIATAMGLSVSQKDDFYSITKIGNFDDGTSFYSMLWAVMPWLRDEGYIRARGEVCSEEVVLTSKALAVLNAKPSALEESFGKQLMDKAQGAASDAGRAAISETVGQVIGVALKNFIS